MPVARRRKPDLVTQGARMRALQRRQHRRVARIGQHRIPQHDDPDIPLARHLADEARHLGIIGFGLEAGIDQHHPATRVRRCQLLRLGEAIHRMDPRREGQHGLAQRLDLAPVALGQIDAVPVAQHQRRDQGRPGISLRPVTRANPVQHPPIGVIGRKALFQPGDPLRGLAGLSGLGRGQIIQRPPGMGLKITQGFVLGRQIGQHPGQQRMLVHIGGIARVIQVLIGQHRAPDQRVRRRRITTSTREISHPFGASGRRRISSCSTGASLRTCVSSQKKCG